MNKQRDWWDVLAWWVIVLGIADLTVALVLLGYLWGSA